MDNSIYSNPVFKEFTEVVDSHVKDKIAGMPSPVFKRFMYEMEVFKHGGYEEVLHAYRRVEAIRKAGWHVGPGRNTMAGSLVNYLLGLTEIDPIKYGLSFERFYNPVMQKNGERPEYEFDTDIPSEELHKIIFEQPCPYDCEDIAYYQMDTLEELNKQVPKGFTFPENDPQTLSLFASGDTEDIFLFGSPTMRRYLRELRPSSLEDLSSLNALYRAESADLIDRFISAKNNGYHRTGNPEYDKILEPTYGIIIYQEQLLDIFNKIFGLDRTEAESLRRQLRKGEPIDPKYEKLITDEILSASRTTFLKAHSISYTMIAYRQVYIKVHLTNTKK